MTPLTRRRRALPAALLAGALGLAACGGGGSDSSVDADAPPPEAAPLTPSESGDVSVVQLDFTAPVVGGGDLDASTLAGTDTIVWFWAPW